MKATVQQLIDTRARSRLFRRKCCCQEKSAKSFSLVTIALVMAAYAYVVVRQLSRFHRYTHQFVDRSQPEFHFCSAKRVPCPSLKNLPSPARDLFRDRLKCLNNLF
jgi:hypothetical protein